MTTPIEFRDVDVIDRAALDARDQANFNSPWLVQYSDGTIFGFDTEDEACEIQRDWRISFGRDPITGAEKKSPDDWLKEPEFVGMVIMDPDGWDRKNYDASWAEEITREEFLTRAAQSTTMWPKGWKFV